MARFVKFCFLCFELNRLRYRFSNTMETGKEVSLGVLPST